MNYRNMTAEELVRFARAAIFVSENSEVVLDAELVSHIVDRLELFSHHVASTINYLENVK